MQVWAVPSTTRAGAPLAAPDVAGALIGCIARADFATRALGEINRALPVAWWTVYRVPGQPQPHDDRPERPPQLCVQASHAVPDIALDCWRIYREGVYRDDTHFADACGLAGNPDADSSGAVMSHCRADDFSGVHRERIYEAHSLSERLSLVCTEHDPADRGALLAVNLYRHRAQPRFGGSELDTVRDLAATLLAVVQRQLELCRETLAPRQRLARRCPGLTARELAVCERLLRGLSFDGIAADLQLSAATVKTYRNRAFERLGIHHRNELFGLALQTAD